VLLLQVASLSRTGDLIIANATCSRGISGCRHDHSASTTWQAAMPIPNEWAVTHGWGSCGSGVLGENLRQPACRQMRLSGGWREPSGRLQGDCSTFGASGSLVNTATGTVVQGQPVRDGANFPSTPVCQSTSVTYTLTFGPFRNNQCGKYRFDSDLSTDLVNTPAWETTDLDFNVVVQGCQTLRGKR